MRDGDSGWLVGAKTQHFCSGLTLSNTRALNCSLKKKTCLFSHLKVCHRALTSLQHLHSFLFSPFPNPLSISRIPTPSCTSLPPTLPLPTSIPRYCLRHEHRPSHCPKLCREKSRCFGEDEARGNLSKKKLSPHDTGSIISFIPKGPSIISCGPQSQSCL